MKRVMPPIALALAVLGPTAALAFNPQPEPPAKISAELVTSARDGTRQNTLTATHAFDVETQRGSVAFEATSGGARFAAGSANVSAPTPEEAAGSLTALVLAITGRTPSGRSTLQLSDVKFEGDSRSFAAMAEETMDWWDAQANLSFDNYRSPRPSLEGLGKLQLNVWGTSSGGNRLSSFAILYFDPADPAKIVGGTIRRHVAVGQVVQGSLVEDSISTAPGDFRLEVQTGLFSEAAIAIDVLPDGTVDVRGVSAFWDGITGNYIVEGTGSANFVVPSP